MDICDATRHIQNGGKIRRTTWDNGVHYYYKDGHLWLHNNQQNDVRYVEIPFHEVLATDWEVYNPEQIVNIDAKDIQVGDTLILYGKRDKVTSVQVHIGFKNHYTESYKLNEQVSKVIQ